MIDLTLTPDEAKEEAGLPTDSPENLPKYPYGLCLYFDSETLEKLGMDASLPVGSILNLTALGKVTGTSTREVQGTKGDGEAETYQSMDVQITAIELGQAAKTDEQRASKLYGGSDNSGSGNAGGTALA